MKTLMVGNGVIGTIYGWALAEAGVDVSHFVRPGRREQYAHGVTLDVLDERKGHAANQMAHYALRCVETIQPSDGYELIIVPVNAQQLEAALRMLAPHAGDAIFLPLTSNWEGTAVLDACLRRDQYLLGYGDGGGTVRNGVYWTNLGAEIHLGEADGRSSDRLLRVKALFERADMRPHLPDNILHWLWVHNASVIGFAAGFARHGEQRAYLQDGALLRVCLHATRELLALCERRGADWKQQPELSYLNWPDWLVVAMMRWLYTTNKSMQRYTAHAASPGSLRETKMHYAAMLRTADGLGADVPALRSLGQYLETIDG